MEIEMALFRSYQKVAYFVAVSETEFCCSFSKNAQIKNLPSLTLSQLIGSYGTIRLFLTLYSIKSDKSRDQAQFKIF